MLPRKLQEKLNARKEANSLRTLPPATKVADFSSNDYLGFSKSRSIFDASHALLSKFDLFENGSTGSRLLTGNHSFYKIVEDHIAAFHNSEGALVFNSGYDANLGFFSSVPQRGDLIIYDEYIHASIRDGITISNANAYKFRHNDLSDLERCLKAVEKGENTIYIVSESVFSMDGDSPDLMAIVKLANTYHAKVIVDEAHAIGIFGDSGCGLVQQLNLESHLFARIITFGKAMGCHGAAVLGSKPLMSYLVNFSRSFIYTTALPPHSLATIFSAYTELLKSPKGRLLHNNIAFFKHQLQNNPLMGNFIESNSAIQSCILGGNDAVKQCAKIFLEKGYDVKPILYPSVPKGKERLRFCIHSYNNEDEITEVLTILSNFASLNFATKNE